MAIGEGVARETMSRQKMALFSAVSDISGQLIYSTEQSPTFSVIKNVLLQTNHGFRIPERARLLHNNLIMSDVIPLVTRKNKILTRTRELKLSKEEMGQDYAAGVDSALFLFPSGDSLMLAYGHLHYARFKDNLVVSVERGFPEERAIEIPRVKVFPQFAGGVEAMDFVDEVFAIDHSSPTPYNLIQRIEGQKRQPLDLVFAAAVRLQELATAAQALGLVTGQK